MSSGRAVEQAVKTEIGVHGLSCHGGKTESDSLGMNLLSASQSRVLSLNERRYKKGNKALGGSQVSNVI